MMIGRGRRGIDAPGFWRDFGDLGDVKWDIIWFWLLCSEDERFVGDRRRERSLDGWGVTGYGRRSEHRRRSWGDQGEVFLSF